MINEENTCSGKRKRRQSASFKASLYLSRARRASDFNIFLADEMKFTSQRNLLSVGRSVGGEMREMPEKRGESEFLA